MLPNPKLRTKKNWTNDRLFMCLVIHQVVPVKPNFSMTCSVTKDLNQNLVDFLIFASLINRCSIKSKKNSYYYVYTGSEVCIDLNSREISRVIYIKHN